jgi:hypothetical protein
MIVLGANILIPALLGKRVWQLLEITNMASGFTRRKFRMATQKYLPPLLYKRGKSDTDVPAALTYLQFLIKAIGQDAHGLFEAEARQRLRSRDQEDWPVLATALSLSCAIWTEVTDFFGAGVAVWTSDRVEIFLKEQSRLRDSEEILAIRKKRDIPSNHQLQRS